jgi:SH3-like domain-containing protein
MYIMAIATQSPRKSRTLIAALLVGLAITVSLSVLTRAHAAGQVATGSVSGLPVPRYVSLKADRVNVRNGPTKDHDVAWVYTRSRLPVEITAEFENWRRIRDWEGAEGWVYHSLLSGRRTALVTPWNKDNLVPLNNEPGTVGAVMARLQSGVVATVQSCTGAWCHISGEGFEGWIPQERLWGVYPNEKLD